MIRTPRCSCRCPAEWVPDEMSSEGEEEAAEEGDDAAAGRGGEAVPAAAQQRSWLEEEPEVLGSPLVAEATAAVPSPPGSKRGSPGEQQQQGQRQQAAPAQARQGVSPRQMSRGWELL